MNYFSENTLLLELLLDMELDMTILILNIARKMKL